MVSKISSVSDGCPTGTSIGWEDSKESSSTAPSIPDAIKQRGVMIFQKFFGNFSEIFQRLYLCIDPKSAILDKCDQHKDIP